VSSAYVRTQITDFLAANSSETVIDLTSQFSEIKELLADNGVQPDGPWLGIEFQGDEEIPIALAATNDQGKYRETGIVYFHIVATASLTAGNAMLNRGETLRNFFRGQRIGDILIDSVSPMNFIGGATLEFEGGYVSGSFVVGYRRDLDL